jgi:tetratricopeptide (TPR) repeat protein
MILHAPLFSHFRHFRSLAQCAVVVAASLTALSSVADEYSDVAKLMKANQMGEALSKADQFLSSKPRDPQMRFMKGVIQSEAGKSNDAINTFTRLTEDFPELPEPYNNLAVLYANSNQFEKAKGALEMAIRTNPSYSTAHENLGDIYAKLASQAYAKALQLDASNTGVSPKLALIRELFSPSGKAVIAAAAPARTPVVVAQAPVTSTPAPAATAPAPSPVVAPVAPRQPSVITASPTGTNQPSIAPPAVVKALAGRDVEASVEAWAKAWSDRDMKAYLASYGKDFVPLNKQSRAEWEADRKTRIMGKAKISVVLSNINVAASGNTATVKFKQDYKADSLATSSRKTLEMVKSGDRWVIVKEISG